MREILTFDDVFHYLERFINFEKMAPLPGQRELRLDRMHALLARFSNPHTAFASFHVAGTKGKGSTAQLIGSVLKAAGYRVGIYSSPHVSEFSERITFDGRAVPEDLFARLTTSLRTELETGAPLDLEGRPSPTFFELLTLLSFMCFRELSCDYGVIEVGIGGRLDTTNVLDPRASVITPLDLEHTALLGDTIESIAREKAGIIKRSRPVFVARQEPAARAVFEELARQRQAPLYFLDDQVEHLSSELSTDGTDLRLRLRGEPEVQFRLRMIGHFQAENAALAYLAIRSTLPELPEQTYASGFAEARLPGRLELVRTDPPIVLDGAHTPLAIRRLLESVEELFPRPGVLLFGSVEGKKSAEMAALLAPRFALVVVSTPGTFKASDPAQVAADFAALNPNTVLEPDTRRAFDVARTAAREMGTHTLVTGSFYLLGEVRSFASLPV
jgi:dihydrofolate synthase/folylpolyglutamate synthase